MTALEQATLADGERAWQAVLERDRRLDGVLFYAVRSTGIYCRPTCPSRRPRREQVQFFFDRAAAEHAGFRACRRCRPEHARAESAEVRLAGSVCRHIEENLESTLTLRTISAAVGAEPGRIQRVFRQVLGVGVREYIKARRFAVFRMYLRVGKPVAEATYEAGYSSSSRVYEDIQSRLGMTPSTYRRRAEGVRVRYTICDSPIGKLLVAATPKGVCKVEIGDSEEKLSASVVGEFPRATVERDDAELKDTVRQIVRHLDGKEPERSLPLDIRATAFQLRVYNELRKIPYGSTRTYSEIARAVKLPAGQRAVARACATNPVALAIPCHRVIAADGTLGGYRWGVERKRTLLEREAAMREKTGAE